MRRQDVTLSSATTSAPIPMDERAKVFQVSIACVLSTGASLTYKVQHTFDAVFSSTFNPATATWFDHPNITGETATKEGTYSSPVTAIRLNVTSYTSGSVTMALLQSSGR